jgi:2-polyprenyl-3-methyl-5-hydroxy-6-metoxy-1,4-benzoquinol methylase
MIICPGCGTELTLTGNSLTCPHNGYRAEAIGGTWYFHPEIGVNFESYDPAGLERLFQHEERQFWFLARKQVIKDLFARYVRRDERVIEVGAGTGNVARTLVSEGYQVAIGEVHRNGLEYAATYGIHERYQFDVTRAPFREHFDVVGLFDVIEHIADDVSVVRNVHQMLRAGGRVIVTVPAHDTLWNQSDIVAHHQRRYGPARLQDLFRDNGFRILELRGFFVSLLPLLYLRTILQPAGEARSAKGEGRGAASDASLEVGPLINGLLRAVLSVENRVLRRAAPRFGGSLALVGLKA